MFDAFRKILADARNLVNTLSSEDIESEEKHQRVTQLIQEGFESADDDLVDLLPGVLGGLAETLVDSPYVDNAQEMISGVLAEAVYQVAIGIDSFLEGSDSGVPEGGAT